MVTRKLELSGTQTQDSIRADITFHLMLLGSPQSAAHSFLRKESSWDRLTGLQHHIFTMEHHFLTCEALADIFMCHIC